MLPGIAAVLRSIDAAGGAGAEGVAQSGNVEEIGVGRVHADAGDVAGVAKTEVGPGLAAVDGAVDAVAVADVAADLGLAHAGVDHVGVGLGGGDGPTAAELKKPSETFSQ